MPVPPIATAAPGRGPKGGMPSPSPHGPKRHVTFLDEEEKMSSGEDPLREPQGQVTGEEG